MANFGHNFTSMAMIGLLALLCMPYALACPNGIASGCCGPYCYTSCSSGSCLVQRNGCSNTCKKCQVDTCKTTCPLNSYLQPDLSNVCIGSNPTCQKCTPCPTCQATCPADYLSEEDTTNPCYATQKCKKCTPCPNCATSCPSGSYSQGPETTNPCNAQLGNKCLKCNTCSSAPGIPSPCNAQPQTCRKGTVGKIIWTGPSGCPSCWACR